MLNIDVVGNVIEPLLPSEEKVYKFLVCGYPTKVIANILCVAPSTIMTHKNRIYQKHCVSSQTELMYKRILELERTINELKNKV